MSTAVIISHLNPVRFYLATGGSAYQDTLPYFEHKTNYFAKVRYSDPFRIQILVNEEVVPGIGVKLNSLETGDELIDTLWDATYYPITPELKEYGDYFVYNMAVPGISYEPATKELCQFVITVPHSTGDIIFKSEPIMIFKDNYHNQMIDNTMLITYGHSENDYEIYFVDADGVADDTLFCVRVEGGFRSDGFTPGGKFTMFQDMQQRPVMLSAVPLNIERLTFGSNYGIPNWMAELMNRIFALDTVTIDGVQYSRSEGAKMERVTNDPLYPMSAWHMDLVKSSNPYGLEIPEPTA